MSDDKTKTGPRDANRVSMSEDYEVQYWTKRFNVSRDQLQDAVREVGNGVDQVAEYFQRKG